MATAAEVLDLATVLANKITTRRPDVQKSVRYFRGEEGRMRFASDEFKQYFESRFEGFSDNWCMPVAQAPIERIHYLGIRVPVGEGKSGVDGQLARDWDRNDGDRGLTEALLMMTIAKRSYGLVSQSSAGPRLTFENPDSAAIIYDGETRQRRAGMLVWADDKNEYAELLLPGSVLSLKRQKRSLVGGERYIAPDATGWSFNPDAAGTIEKKHPFGVVPLVEFRNQSLLDNDPISDIGLVMPMQDTINLVWAYTLNSLDYMSLPGRVVLNGEVPKEDVLNEAGVKIGERPMELDSLIRDRIAWLQGTGISIAEWKPASVDGFSKIISQGIGHVATQTRTPSHYLMSAGDNVPAASYELAEAGLVSKAMERISYANTPVRELSRLLALAGGDTQRAEAIAAGRVLWKKAQYRSEAQLMDGLIKMSQAGFPFEWLAEEYGLTLEDVARVMDMKRAEANDPVFAAVMGKLGASSVGQ